MIWTIYPAHSSEGKINAEADFSLARAPQQNRQLRSLLRSLGLSKHALKGKLTKAYHGRRGPRHFLAVRRD